MKHLITTAAGLATLGMSFALAQSADLSSTQLMKQQGQFLYRELNTMVKGEAPYDQAKVDAALAGLTSTSSRIPEAFPAANKGKASPGSRYSASTKVWDDQDDFKKKAANLQQTVASQKDKITSLETLKASYRTINNACESCHETYRLRSG